MKKYIKPLSLMLIYSSLLNSYCFAMNNDLSFNCYPQGNLTHKTMPASQNSSSQNKYNKKPKNINDKVRYTSAFSAVNKALYRVINPHSMLTTVANMYKPILPGTKNQSPNSIDENDISFYFRNAKYTIVVESNRIMRNFAPISYAKSREKTDMFNYIKTLFSNLFDQWYINHTDYRSDIFNFDTEIEGNTLLIIPLKKRIIEEYQKSDIADKYTPKLDSSISTLLAENKIMESAILSALKDKKEQQNLRFDKVVIKWLTLPASLLFLE